MNKAERAAQALLDEVGSTGTAVDVEQIVRQLGLVLTKERLAEDLSGILIRKPEAVPVIGVNSSHHPRRQRFSIAHELGHLRLKHKGEVIVDSGIRVHKRDGTSKTATVQDEREANAFAAALLMPASLIQQQVNLLGDSKYSQARIVSTLARNFEVSEEAMHYRLLNLGIA